MRYATWPATPVDIAGLEVAAGDPSLTLPSANWRRSLGRSGVELALGVFNWDGPGAPDAPRTSCALFNGQARSLLVCR